MLSQLRYPLVQFNVEKTKEDFLFLFKDVFCNQTSIDNRGFLFSFSVNFLSFCSTHSQIYFFDGCQNISLKQISVPPTKPFVGLMRLDLGSECVAHQQNPQLLALSAMTCKQFIVLPKAVMGGCRTRFSQLKGYPQSGVVYLLLLYINLITSHA